VLGAKLSWLLSDMMTLTRDAKRIRFHYGEFASHTKA